jgi:hypothetical protein
MVTVLTTRPYMGGPGDAAQVSFLAVEDGDTLVVTLPDPAPPPDVIFASYAVSFAGAAANAPVQYNVALNSGCGAGAQSVDLPITVPMYGSCALAQNTLLASATDGSGAVVGYSFLKNVAKPAAGATPAVGPLTFAAPSTTTFHATSLPAATASLEFQNFYFLANEQLFYGNNVVGLVTDVGGTAVPTATGFADALQSFVSMRALAGVSSSSGFLRREAPSAAPPAFDFATALPFVSTSAATGTGRPDVTTSTTAPVTTADGAALLLVWTDAATGRADTWTFIVPPTAINFTVPALPADATAFVPAAGAFIDTVSIVEATQLPGYKELKSLPVQPLLTEPLDVILNRQKALPKPGTVRITSWSSNRRT